MIIAGPAPEKVMEIGLGMAAAIFVDAYLIRTVFIPAAMHTLGRANWWLPAWLDRLLPRLHVEPADRFPFPARSMTSWPMQVASAAPGHGGAPHAQPRGQRWRRAL
jgi:hypothetical protein